RVPALLGEGRLDRAVRVIARADAFCPTSAAESWAPRVTALVELGRMDEALALASTIEAAPDASAEARAAAKAARAAPGVPVGEQSAAAASRAFEAAAVALSSKRHAEAKRGFLEAWSLHRPNGPSLFWAGMAAKEEGAAAEAQRLFDRAMVEI